MTTLAANLSSSAVTMRVNAADADPAPYYQIDDEIVQLMANSTTIQEPEYGPRRSVDETLWQIERAVSGTTAATHLSGATLTAVYDPSVGGGVGGGAIAVTGQEGGEVTDVTSITVATITDEGGGAVTVTPAILSDSVPAGPLPHGTLFIRQDPDETAGVLQLNVWNQDAEGFEYVGLGDLLLGNSIEWTGFSANGTEGNATLQFGGNPGGQIIFHLKDEDGANDRHYELHLGNEVAELFFTDPNAASPANGIVMNGTGVMITGNLGFFETPPVAKPTGVAVTAEAIHAALVSLGLIGE